MLFPQPRAATPYAELLAATNFSFLRGASHPFEMVGQAAGLGLSGIGICDRNCQSGVVRAFAAAKDLAEQHPDFRLVVGTRLVFFDEISEIAVYPIDREGCGPVRQNGRQRLLETCPNYEITSSLKANVLGNFLWADRVRECRE